MGKLSRAEIGVLPEGQRFAAILEHFTENERALLASVADQINALPEEKQLEMAQQLAAFSHQRIAN